MVPGLKEMQRNENVLVRGTRGDQKVSGEAERRGEDEEGEERRTRCEAKMSVAEMPAVA